MRTLAALAVVVLLSSCGSGSSSDAESAPTAEPQDAVRQLLVALEAGSCQDVKEIVVTPEAVDCEMIHSLGGSFADEGIDLADVTYSTGKIAGSSGSVTTDWGDGEPAESWDVERLDGTWKVVFDSEE